jgi:STAM-binding protein
MRYAALVADKLSEHPAARLPENRSALKAVQKTLPEVLNRLEMLKPRIEMRYNSWQKTLERRKETAAALEGERPPSRSRQEYSFSDPAVAGNNMTLAAAENSELAVKMAHKEIRRRDAVRLASRHPGASSEKEQERRTAGLWDDWEAALSQNGRHSSLHDDQIRLDMEASRRRLDSQHDISLEGLGLRPPKGPPRNVRPEQRFGEKSDLRQSSHTEYRYPSIAKSQPLTSQNNEYDSQARPKSPRRASLPPKPPKERLDSSVSPVLPPRRPEKLTTEPVNLPPVSNSGGPSSYTFAPSAYLENGNPLRTVFLPPTLREQFLAHAASNTRRNLETCGMLCGTLMSNALFISKVVIPEQESTSDTCETINESAFFDYCAAEDLMVLGWIHTHPTQTCFMSSRDLHTHCGYQIMMPESIAIVCAPSKTPS